MAYITWRQIKDYNHFVELQEAVRRDPSIVNNRERQRDVLKALDEWEARYRHDNPLPDRPVSRKDVLDHGRELFPQGKGGGSSNANAKADPGGPRPVQDTDIESAFLGDL